MSTHTQTSPELNYPLVAIYQSIDKAMSMGVKGFSENRRDIYSKAFLVPQDDKITKRGFRDRGIAKITVTGDRRPYTVYVEVLVQRGKVKPNPDDIVYQDNHYDKRLAEKLLKDIMTNLKKNSDQNIIDDFKSF